MQTAAKSIAQTDASVPELVAHIRERIETLGPVTFAWFMEQALYHPQHGYYSSGRTRIGRQGDYFTNVSVGPPFGELLAAQFAEIWRVLDRPRPFTIVEQGAHNGDFAADVLTALRDDECFHALEYHIVEPFVRLREQQRARLADWNVTWHDTLAELPPFIGVHFSNELLDAFPVHLLESDEDQTWSEKYVTLERGAFRFEHGPLSSQRLHDFAAPLRDLVKAEVNLAAIDWLRNIASKLQRGLILICDYGCIERCAGTLRVHSAHRLLASPFDQIGNADITAHVDWASMIEAAHQAGLASSGVVDQHHFLTGVVSELWRSSFEKANAKTRRQLQTLLQPTMLGRTFQFLALSRGLPAAAKLSGFRYAGLTR